MSENVQVVSVAIVNHEKKRVLLAQRSISTSYPFLWSTPGVEIKPMESPSDALRRELGDELGVKLIPLEDPPIVYSYNTRLMHTGAICTISCYRIRHTDVSGTYTCGDKTIGLGWFDAYELSRLRLAPADDAERASLMELLT